MSKPRIAIVCAMLTEVWPLVRRWRRVHRTVAGRSYTFFESGNAVLLAGGIGYEPGHCAAAAMVSYASPDLLVAAGLAGALKPEIKRGQTFTPASVIDALTGTEIPYANGAGIAVSSRVIAGAAHKQELADKFAADIVDMEGFAVAQIAHAYGIPVIAAKAVSDELEFELPPLQPFVGAEGEFQAARFTLQAIVHPAWWPIIARLKRNSDFAANALAELLGRIIEGNAQGNGTPLQTLAHLGATHV